MEELLNGCICCNLVGQLGDALETLRKDVKPDRIIIETSGSAFPATLALEVNRLAAETGNYVLDGVIVVIDVENWEGYEDTSYTAKMQARYTDLIVLNKWENVSERRLDDCVDRIGDIEVEIARTQSVKGFVKHDVLLGFDSSIAKNLSDLSDHHHVSSHTNGNGDAHKHSDDHQSEVEVLSVTLKSRLGADQGVNMESLETLLLAAPKTEIYRIKAILQASRPPASSTGDIKSAESVHGNQNLTYILNWAFGRWTVTPTRKESLGNPAKEDTESVSIQEASTTQGHIVMRMTVILSRGEANAWSRRIRDQGYIELENCTASEGAFDLDIKKIL